MTTEKTQEMEGTLTVYEVSYLLLPSLATEQVPGKAAALKEALTSLGGEVLADEDPILIDLAYPMTKVVQTVRHKATTGYFGWIKFEMPQHGMEAVKKALDANDEILRYLIIKTVKENTLLEGKMKFEKDQALSGNAALQAEDKAKREEELEASVDSGKEIEVEGDKPVDEVVM